MCESTVVIRTDENDEEVMNDVIKVTVNDRSVICLNITGEIKEISDVAIDIVDSLKHYIILKRL